MKTNADAVVIGGGVIGTAVAYYLSRKGLDVCSIERKGLADGTSGRCDGRVIVFDQIPGDSCKLAKMSLDMFPTLSDELGFDIKWSREGTILLTENEQEFEVAKRHAARMVEEEKLPYKVLDQKELREREPYVADDIVGALDITCDGSVNPMALTQGFSYGSKKNGATVEAYTSVTGIKLDDSGAVSRVVTDRGEIATKYVVNAAGVWTPVLGSMVGLKLPVKPRQGQILVTERHFGAVRNPVSELGYIMTRLESREYQRVMTPEMEKYGIAFNYEPTEAGTGLIGTSRTFVGYDVRVSKEVLKELAKRATRYFPAIKHVHAIRSYAGLRPHTPDHMPIISDTEIPGFFIATGHEGNGIGMAPITGELMACLITGEKTRINVEAFAWSRFTKQQRFSR